MKLYFPGVLSLILFSSLIILSCSKSDPQPQTVTKRIPTAAELQAKLLAGDSSKSKTWRLLSLGYQAGSGTSSIISLPACFSDNLYTFNNNLAQDYSGAEGATKCSSSDPTIMETGTWAFTIDGIRILIEVGNTYSNNGLFSPESILAQDPNSGQYYSYPIGYPYPALVQTLTATSLVMVMNNTVGTSQYVYTLTFIAQ